MAKEKKTKAELKAMMQAHINDALRLTFNIYTPHMAGAAPWDFQIQHRDNDWDVISRAQQYAETLQKLYDLEEDDG